MWQSCDLRKQLSSISTTKDWWVREKTAHSAYIDECTDLDEWHSQRVRFDFALHDVTGTTDELMWNHKEQYISALGSVEQIWHCHLWARERGENERGIERRICLILNDETWRNMHALNIFTLWLVTPTVRCYVLCDGHVGWVWVHIKPKPPCSQTNPFGYCTVSLLHLPMVF